MNTHDRNIAQLAEAFSPDNKYFYWLEIGKNAEEATHNELLMFYISHKGAEHFAETHKEEK